MKKSEEDEKKRKLPSPVILPRKQIVFPGYTLVNSKKPEAERQQLKTSSSVKGGLGLNKTSSRGYGSDNYEDSMHQIFVIDILCINCQEMINEKDIDRHSLKCVAASQISNSLNSGKEEESSLSEIDLKLRKLLKSISTHKASLKTPERYLFLKETIDHDGAVLTSLEMLTIKFLEVTELNQNNLPHLKKSFRELKNIISNFKGAPAILIYLERVKVLVIEKFKLLNEKVINWTTPEKLSTNEQTNKDKELLERQIIEKQKERDNLVELVDFYKKKTESLQQSINKESQFYSPRSSLRSNIQELYPSSEDTKKEQMTTLTSGKQVHIRYNPYFFDDLKSETLNSKLSSSDGSFQNTESNDIYLKSSPSDFEDLLFEAQSEERQRLFYSKCITAKMKLDAKSLSQRIPISLIYKDALDKEIKESNWDPFIESALKRPEDYIDISKIKDSQKRKIFQNRLAEISKKK